ncbi:putative MFS transporter [Dactylonectria macrodidyma]|uniref:MFS transporter n=1 Tax=Dactylonectria macrodidyma TaxID=307937 RepID=A0A9P9FNQ1_9HYPO|nr:putative MFS transporter [Dactylonectria macrodidyma]
MATTTVTQTVLVPSGENELFSESSIPPTPLDDSGNDSSECEKLAPRSSRLQKVVVTIQLSGVTFTSSLINGLVIVGLPAITEDLQLPSSLAFWPASVSGLATASTLLIAGSVADVLGPRGVDLVGCFASGALMIGSGSARKGTELVAMRALQGVGLALHLASSVAIITQLMPKGRSRNLAFSCLGLSQPLGFSVGLVLGGIFVDTIGWRAGWFLSGGLTLLFAVIGVWALPRSPLDRRLVDILEDVKTKIDWVGAILASSFMTLLCYLLAVLSADVTRIKEPFSIVLLALSPVALLCFIGWVHHRVQKERPALIPNSLWKNATFSSICATIALSFAVLNSMELFCSLFFQEIQELPAIQASIRILPCTLVGALVNLIMGFFVHKFPAIWIVTVTSVLCAGSPLLMAVIQPSWPYWGNAFVAQLLQPVSCDALFTVGLIVITDVFPEDTQALAGAVFNTAAQFGSALGLAILQVISTMVTKEQKNMEEIPALMEGYRASFWTMFGFMILCTVIGILGLRRTGKIGLKRD